MGSPKVDVADIICRLLPLSFRHDCLRDNDLRGIDALVFGKMQPSV
jgi:hypothetical protein